MSRHHSIELLESRIAPATLTGTLVNGVLKLVPSDGISPIDADLVQIGVDTFRLITSAPNVDFVGVKSIIATLTEFPDSFDIIGQDNQFRGNITILGKGGSDNITVQSTTITGNVTISNNDLNASIGVVGAIKVRGAVKITTPGVVNAQGFMESLTIVDSKAVTMAFGDFRKVTITAPGTEATLDYQSSATTRGAFLYKGSVASDTLSLAGAFAGRPNIMLGDGNNTLNIYMGSRFDAGINIKGGVNADIVSITGSGQGTLQIAGVVSFAAGDGQNSLNITSTRIGGAIKFVGGISNDNVTVHNSLLGGVLSTQLRNGGNGVLVQGGATLAGGLAVVGGEDTDFIQTFNSSVLGIARLALGNGVNKWEGVGTSFDGGFVYSGGTGNDTLDSFGTMMIRVLLTVTVGDGVNTVDMDGTNIFGNATFTGGAVGTDHFNFQNNGLFHGNLTVRAGNGANNLTFLSSFMSVFTYVGGADVDTLSMLNFGFLTRGKAKLGGGNDFASFTTPNFITFQIDGEGGTDTLNQSGLPGLTALNFESPVV